MQIDYSDEFNVVERTELWRSEFRILHTGILTIGRDLVLYHDMTSWFIIIGEKEIKLFHLL
jgi:hypothetical protein